MRLCRHSEGWGRGVEGCFSFRMLGLMRLEAWLDLLLTCMLDWVEGQYDKWDSILRIAFRL